ncbi:zf-HC2 domain-containing protein [Streptomyces sp. NPDC000410]|uniref:zf-HC2 domain-containing protein n=1 Tax=Streptomyces sp. NPDC000410 TaxID=3154254 RepID=UPI0033170091
MTARDGARDRVRASDGDRDGAREGARDGARQRDGALDRARARASDGDRDGDRDGARGGAHDAAHDSDGRARDRRTRDWHVTDALAGRYAAGTLPDPDAWSLEKHVESCAACAARVSAAVRATSAGTVLESVRTALLTEAAGAASAAAEGHAVRQGPMGRGRARWAARRAWIVGPALHGAWLVALALVVVGAVGLAYGAGFTGARPLLLAVAPVLPLAGVAVSYGRHADPMHEVAASTPAGGLRLLLTRTATVLAVSVPLLTASGALLPPLTGAPGAAAWLLPGLALTLAALALGSYVGCRTAASVLAVGWLGATLGPALLAGRLLTAPAAELTGRIAPYVSGPAAQTVWAAAAAACAGLLALRRRAFDYPSFGHWGNP